MFENQCLNVMLSRRSIRQFTSEKLSHETLEVLLRAAMSAPSAGNQQDWQFIVSSDALIFKQIMKVHPYAQMLLEASHVIAVCGDLSREKLKNYWIQDCSAASQNILLAAHSLNLGAVWLGIYPENARVEGLKEIFSLPDYIVPLSLIALGYPKVKLPKADRYDTNLVHYDHW